MGLSPADVEEITGMLQKDLLKDYTEFEMGKLVSQRTRDSLATLTPCWNLAGEDLLIS